IGRLGRATPIDPALARALAADARWRRIITDPPAGTPIDVGTTIYRPPAAMRRRVTHRDQTCRFPGCAVSAMACELDHLTAHKPDGTGGPTADANLLSLCKRHHRLRHQTHWHARLHDHGIVDWTSPTGRKY